MEKLDQEIIDLSNRDTLYWKNYIRIRTLGYSSIREYYDKTMRKRIYNRINEGILYREYEASILMNAWCSSHYDPKQYEIVDTILFFFEDFKNEFPWTWKVAILFLPFLGKTKQFVDLIGKNSKENVNVSIY